MSTDKKILNYQNISRKLASHRRRKEKIVFVTGCFDIMHLGHIIFLNYAKRQGNILVVGLGSDKSVKSLKPDRPIFNQKFRSRVLASLETVDYVVINREKLVNYNIDFSILISKIKPDIFVVPLTDKKLNYKRKLVEKYDGKIKTCHRLPPNHLKGGISSTKILEKLL